MNRDTTIVDCNYIVPKFAASYLLTEGDSAAFIENNTVHAQPYLMRALEDRGMTPEQVEFIVITHVHLDHAGGTSALAEKCPNATVIAHPKAARHIIKPERLIQGATAVYGEEMFAKLYGTIKPLDENRVRAMEDGEALVFGDTELRFFYTLGHATHHFCIHDVKRNAVFTGDSYGLQYPMLQEGTEPFIFPSTTPSDFDPDEMLVSIDKILSTGAEHAYLTHFGRVWDIRQGGQMLKENVTVMKYIFQDAIESTFSGGDLTDFCKKRVGDFFEHEINRREIHLTEDMKRLITVDTDLNAQGIAFSAEKRRKDQDGG